MKSVQVDFTLASCEETMTTKGVKLASSIEKDVIHHNFNEGREDTQPKGYSKPVMQRVPADFLRSLENRLTGNLERMAAHEHFEMASCKLEDILYNKTSTSGVRMASSNEEDMIYNNCAEGTEENEPKKRHRWIL